MKKYVTKPHLTHFVLLYKAWCCPFWTETCSYCKQDVALR